MVDFWEEGWEETRWENEGGSVCKNHLDELWEGEELDVSCINEFVKAKMDADWEPSESETFVSNIVARTEEEVNYQFTCLISEAIRHVKKFFFTRTEVATAPTVAQQVGEFVTELRRLLRGPYAAFTEFANRDLTKTDIWANVGVPNSTYYNWSFSYPTKEGAATMTLAKAQVLCENAQKMAITDKTLDEEFREINNGLNNLLRETTALDTLVYKAKEINAQAEVVCGNLCLIAESLK